MLSGALEHEPSCQPFHLDSLEKGKEGGHSVMLRQIIDVPQTLCTRESGRLLPGHGHRPRAWEGGMEYLRVTQASEHPVLAKPLGPAKLAGGHLQGVQIQTLSLCPITDALVKLVIGLDHHPLLVQVATGDGASFVASCITKVTLSTRTPRNVHMLIDCLLTCEMACPAEA